MVCFLYCHLPKKLAKSARSSHLMETHLIGISFFFLLLFFGQLSRDLFYIEMETRLMLSVLFSPNCLTLIAPSLSFLNALGPLVLATVTLWLPLLLSISNTLSYRCLSEKCYLISNNSSVKSLKVKKKDNACGKNTNKRFLFCAGSVQWEKRQQKEENLVDCRRTYVNGTWCCCLSSSYLKLFPYHLHYLNLCVFQAAWVES